MNENETLLLFEELKELENQITTEGLRKTYSGILKLSEKYQRTNQVSSLRKLEFLTRVYLKEEKLLTLGVDTFIYRDVLEDILDKIPQNVGKIIEIENYQREIPDEIVEVIDKTKGIFDQLYVVFTDYTKKEERRIEKERREADPILFGVFKEDNLISDRFYVLGDWVDEYCDLTIDKLIQTVGNDNFLHKEEYPKTPEELIEVLGKYKSLDTRRRFKIGETSENKKPGFFQKNKIISEEKGMKSNVDLTRDRYFSASRIPSLEDYELASLTKGQKFYPWSIDCFYKIDYSLFSSRLFFPWLKNSRFFEENFEGKGHCQRCGKKLRPWGNYYDLCFECNNAIEKELMEGQEIADSERQERLRLELFG